MARKCKTVKKFHTLLTHPVQGHNLLKIRNFNIAFLPNRKHIYNAGWIFVTCPLESLETIFNFIRRTEIKLIAKVIVYVKIFSTMVRCL